MNYWAVWWFLLPSLYSEAAAGQTSCVQTAAAAIPAPGDCADMLCCAAHCKHHHHGSYVRACCRISCPHDIHLAGSLTQYNSRNTTWAWYHCTFQQSRVPGLQRMGAFTWLTQSDCEGIIRSSLSVLKMETPVMYLNVICRDSVN